MATIEFTAFVDETVTGNQGGVFVLKTSEPHRRKNDQDQWETTARTYRDVKVSRESGINLDAFQKGDRVKITGTEKTEERAGIDKQNQPKKFYTLVVWADQITRDGIEHGQSAAAPVANDPWPSTPAEPYLPDSAETPF